MMEIMVVFGIFADDGFELWLIEKILHHLPHCNVDLVDELIRKALPQQHFGELRGVPNRRRTLLEHRLFHQGAALRGSDWLYPPVLLCPSCRADVKVFGHLRTPPFHEM